MSQENRTTPPQKGPVAPTLSAPKGGVALEVASWKVLRYRGLSQLHCRLARYSGPLSKHLFELLGYIFTCHLRAASVFGAPLAAMQIAVLDMQKQTKVLTEFLVQNNLSGDTFSIEAPQNLLRTKIIC